MKRGTPRHPKLLHLSELLNLPEYAAAGLLEMMWHFTAEFALDGAIGKHSDGAIAKALCWDRASTELVEALVCSGWLDRCECHRLRVHDWKDHADQTVQRVLAKRNQEFAPCYDDPSTVLAPSKMPLPKANSLKPIPKANTKNTYSNEFEQFWSAYPKKTGKQAAYRKWKTAKKNGLPPLVELLEILERHKGQDFWKQGKIYKPQNWLGDGHWEDELNTNSTPQPTMPDLKFGIDGEF